MLSATPARIASSPARWAAAIVLLGCSALALAWLVGRVAATGFPIPIDYYQYWSAGWLVGRGENPYDPVRLLEVQAAGGMTNPMPVMSWHPPWTMAVALPFGQLPLTTGCLVWILVQTAAVVLAADLLWWAFGGPARLRWMGWTVAAAFAPTYYLIGTAQITGLCLLGVAGFAAGMRAGRPAAAGAAVALTALKPHLLALFGLALVLEATRTRSTRTAVLAGAAVLAAATGLVLALNGNVLDQYLAAFIDRDATNPYRVTDWPSPTLGWHLRAWLAPGSFGVQSLPLAAAAAATAVVWWRWDWDWLRAVPLLVVGSVLVAPYGAWVYDLVLLLVPVLAIAARLAACPAGNAVRVAAGAGLVLVSAGVLMCVRTTANYSLIRIEWVAPVVLVGLAAAAWAGRPQAGVSA